MKKGDIVEGVIEHYSFPNRGCFYLEESETGKRKVLVKGALPGQKVSARVIKKKEGRAEARLLDVLERSPLETKKPMCNHFYECGGCTYQTMSYTNQLKLKEQMVKELLEPVIDFESDDMKWDGILASPSQFRYRNKMEFTFGDTEKDGPLTLGLHRTNTTYDILSIDSCAIVNPAWNAILKYTQNFFRRYAVPQYNRITHEGVLRNLVLRESATDGSILVNLVTTTHYHIDESTRNIPWNEKRSETVDDLHLPEYVAGLLSLGDTEPKGLDGYTSHGYGKNKKDKGTGRFYSLSHYSKIAGVLYTECDTLADAIIPDTVTLLYGDDYLIEEVLGLKFKISPFSFFQTNTKGSEVLYSRVRDYAYEALGGSSADNIKTGVIYDLYSGTGTIAQLMSPVADKVYGIEIVEEAVEAARDNARLNRLTNCEFIAGDVLKKLDEIEDKPDLIILDPPRDGLNPKALKKILDYGVQNIVYISCKPTALARDLEIFNANGYKVVRGSCCDMFPNTQHVETVVLLGWKDNL